MASPSDTTKWEVPEGWWIQFEPEPTTGRIHKYYTNKIGQRFPTLTILWDYVEFAKQKKFSIYGPDLPNEEKEPENNVVETVKNHKGKRRKTKLLSSLTKRKGDDKSLSKATMRCSSSKEILIPQYTPNDEKEQEDKVVEEVNKQDDNGRKRKVVSFFTNPSREFAVVDRRRKATLRSYSTKKIPISQNLPNVTKEKGEKVSEEVKKDEGGGGQTKPSLTRPPRTRKAVDRYPVEAVVRRPATNKLLIYPGRGTQLKDIPNVAFKMSKRKIDNNLLLLHNIIFGRMAKGTKIKKNIGLFSGFVWTENEEKERTKVKQKLDKCVKEKLLDFCNILDIPINKVTVRKDDLAVAVLEFLESPHPTTETFLSDKKKAKKRKQNSQVGEKQKPFKAEDEDEKAELPTGEDGSEEDSYDDGNPNSFERDGEDGKEHHSRNQTAVAADKRSSKGRVKGNTQLKGHSAKSPRILSQKRSSSSPSMMVTSEAETDSNPSSAKKIKLGKEHNKGQNTSVKEKPSKMNVCKSTTKAMKKDQEKTGKKKDEVAEVTGEELRAQVAVFLKDADLNSTKLTDILRELGSHFHTDVSHRKEEVKAIVTEVVTKMMTDEEEEEEDTDETGNHSMDEDDNDTYYD